MKKIRFGDLVRNSGRPKTLTLWTAPDKSKELQQAIRGNRVLSVQRHNVGTKADVGEIGFRQQKDALYLIFPRRLPTAGGDPVIGINYDLLEEPAPSDPVRLAEIRPAQVPTRKREAPKPPQLKVLPAPMPTSPPKPRGAPRPVPPPPAPPTPKPQPAAKSRPIPNPPPKPKRFRVVVRAVAETEIDIVAHSEKEARARALQGDPHRAVPASEWKRRVLRVSVEK